METTRPVLLAVSFGSSHNDTREACITAVERALQEAYPAYEVRRAFTSGKIIRILEKREGVKIDTVEEAMDRILADGVREVLVQPTHVMPGFEYDDAMKALETYRDRLDSLKIGAPLLIADEDYIRLVQVMAEQTAAYRCSDTAVIFMGHGTEHPANSTYAKLQTFFHQAGYENCLVGTVEGTPTIEDVVESLKPLDVKKAVLLPLMLVAGDHAKNDMAGDEEDSWKSILTAAGYEVTCVLDGMGQYPGVRSMIVDHAAAAL